MDCLIQDLHFACRSLLKSRGFVIVAVASLALSLGANTAIFSFMNAVFIKPLPYDEPDQLVTVMEVPYPYSGGANSPQGFRDMQRQNTLFQSMAASSIGSVSLGGTEEPVSIPDARVSAHYFDILRLHPALGRTFSEGEDQPGNDHVTILSDTLWHTQFGADPKIVGNSIRLDGESYTIIGVLPKGTPLERGWPRLWRPLSFVPSEMERDFRWLSVLARMKPEVSLEQARAVGRPGCSDVAAAPAFLGGRRGRQPDLDAHALPADQPLCVGDREREQVDADAQVQGRPVPSVA